MNSLKQDRISNHVRLLDRGAFSHAMLKDYAGVETQLQWLEAAGNHFGALEGTRRPVGIEDVHGIIDRVRAFCQNQQRAAAQVARLNEQFEKMKEQYADINTKFVEQTALLHGQMKANQEIKAANEVEIRRLEEAQRIEKARSEAQRRESEEAYNERLGELQERARGSPPGGQEQEELTKKLREMEAGEQRRVAEAQALAERDAQAEAEALRQMREQNEAVQAKINAQEREVQHIELEKKEADDQERVREAEVAAHHGELVTASPHRDSLTCMSLLPWFWCFVDWYMYLTCDVGHPF